MGNILPKPYAPCLLWEPFRGHLIHPSNALQIPDSDRGLNIHVALTFKEKYPGLFIDADPGLGLEGASGSRLKGKGYKIKDSEYSGSKEKWGWKREIRARRMKENILKVAEPVRGDEGCSSYRGNSSVMVERKEGCASGSERGKGEEGARNVNAAVGRDVYYPARVEAEGKEKKMMQKRRQYASEGYMEDRAARAGEFSTDFSLDSFGSTSGYGSTYKPTPARESLPHCIPELDRPYSPMRGFDSGFEVVGEGRGSRCGSPSSEYSDNDGGEGISGGGMGRGRGDSSGCGSPSSIYSNKNGRGAMEIETRRDKMA